MIDTLFDLPIGDAAYVVEAGGDDAMKRRLWDLGFTRGTRVEAVQASPSGDPIAYRIRGTVIAIRNKDAKEIKMTYEGGATSDGTDKR